MKQIFVNLLTNALKYSNTGTTITVSAKAIKDPKYKVEIIFKDQGFGIKKADLKKIFSKYETIKNANSGKVDSIGIGLASVKYLVEQHHGEIDVKSVFGKGSQFIIKL